MNELHAGMRLFTVYRNTKDYPGKIVVRGCVTEANLITHDTEPTYVGDSMDEARASIPEGLHRCPRMLGDDPVIVEVWL